ncbi:dihydroxy-acid dehydratase [Pseudonocardia sp. MH-G8]|uniref:dihydroxy-acid dehydratase domain-containing protein n=1 Tax=Pseudonocardia sp. MH-G8 TaxID=1854588 RepID=UPI001E2BB6A5|nr:dihydroxy-acid dehydratase [Pseudonocardia sp. MH-G8]
MSDIDSSTHHRAARLRSQNRFGGLDLGGFAARSWMKTQGLADRDFDCRAVIGICNTYSELAPCNAHFRELAEHVKRGVREAGGLPVEFPVMSLGETILRPTSMLFRNLVSMDVEESIRANPIDGVVLLCGCDKTTPALLMGAASCDLPTIVVSGGPMLTGRFRGRALGSGTDVFTMAEEVRAGRMSEVDFREAESCMSRSAGHCNTMGTASTPFGIACGQIDVGNAATEMTSEIAEGARQADGSVRPEPTFDARHVADAVRYMARLPPEANVPFLTLTATTMPFIGRG